MEHITDTQKELLQKSCLVLTDDDFMDIKSIDDINIHRIRNSISDVTHANMVMYDGKFGHKVLKIRMPRVGRPFYQNIE